MDHVATSKATVVVGLDFGTSFSGFAYALVSDPKTIHKFYDWPKLGPAGGKNYCKTQTSLLYVPGTTPGSYILDDWGYSALFKMAHTGLPRRSTLNGAPSPQFLTGFKLHLANKSSSAGDNQVSELPSGITARRAISDYLRKMSELIISVLQKNLGNHICMEDIQWCITVPAIWDEVSKQEMIICAEISGLVQGPACKEVGASPHPLMIVLEPEAASFYCQSKMEPKSSLVKGDKLLIVDVGGGTVDIVLHEKVGPASSLRVREVSPSSGGLCGGSYVDQRFLDFITTKIRCFREFAQNHTSSVLKLKGWWESQKYQFDGKLDIPLDFELPARLATAWEEDDMSASPGTYDAVELSLEDMKGIFDPVVDDILELISEKIVPDLKVMMVVGGFSGSPYLMRRILERFSEAVGAIMIPPEPGSAICCGAVAYGIGGADLILSRMSRKTYGINVSRPFRLDDPPRLMIQTDDGEAYCTDVFKTFMQKGQEAPLDHFVSHRLVPLEKNQNSISISLYSTTDSDPKYVTDANITKEGTFVFSIPNEEELGQQPQVNISMFFGRTTTEVVAEGINFAHGKKFKMPPVIFQKGYRDDDDAVEDRQSELPIV